MRIAFFGGTFDPPHCGHLAIASAAANRLRLDKVWFAPVAMQPLKDGVASASFEDRLAMVRLAVAGDMRFEASAEDAAREDGQPNYTIDVLQRLKSSLRPEDHLFCLIGADSFLDFPRWHRASELLFLCDFIVAARPGFRLEKIATGLPEGVSVSGKPLIEAGLTTFTFSAKSKKTHLYLLPDLDEDISATNIRAAIAGDETAGHVLQPEVAAYIRAHDLYH